MAWYKVLSWASLLLALGYQILGPAGFHRPQTPAKTVNIQNLIADLGNADADKRSAAALSVLYLAEVPELKSQLHSQELVAALMAVASQPDPQDPPQHQTLPVSLLALAKLVPGGMRVQQALLQPAFMRRLQAVLAAGVPSWQGASAVLLHTLHAQQPGPVDQFVEQHGSALLDTAMGLLEAGALSNSTDALTSGARLLELLAGPSSTCSLLVGSGASQVLMQVVVTYSNSSVVQGAVLRVLDRVAARERSLLTNMTEVGLVAPLLVELRQYNKHSLPAVLALVGRLAALEEGADELIQSGVLSACGQLYFQAKAEAVWRDACLNILCDLSQAERLPSGSAADAGPLYLMTSLLRRMRDVKQPGLHNAILEALRDMAPSRQAAESLVQAGAVPLLAHILKQNVTEGEFEEKAWLLQSQRSAAMVLALLALQPPLRPQVVQQGGLRALATCIAGQGRLPGLMQQVRITATAALVPILGEDGLYNEAAVQYGVLEPLVHMYYSSNEAEQQAARRVMALLGADPAVADMYRRASIEL